MLICHHRELLLIQSGYFIVISSDARGNEFTALLNKLYCIIEYSNLGTTEFKKLQDRSLKVIGTKGSITLEGIGSASAQA